MAELLNAKPREIKAFLRGQLTPGRTQELQTKRPITGQHVQQTIRIGLDAEPAVVLEGRRRRAGVVIEFTVWSVGESIGDVSVDAGQRDGAAPRIEMVRRVDAGSILPDEPQPVLLNERPRE